jgi:hypothetical protein
MVVVEVAFIAEVMLLAADMIQLSRVPKHVLHETTTYLPRIWLQIFQNTHFVRALTPELHVRAEGE